MKFSEALRCEECGLVDNQADEPWKPAKQPDGACDNCGCYVYECVVMPTTDYR